jgi:hypothetical protein
MSSARAALSTGSKFVARGVIRIIVEALIFPEGIHSRVQVTLPSAKASERNKMFIPDLILAQSPGELIRIVLGGWSATAEWSERRLRTQSVGASADR